MENLIIKKKQKINTHDALLERANFLGSFFGFNNKDDYLPENLSGNRKESVLHSTVEEQSDTGERIKIFNALLDETTSVYSLTMDNQENGKIVLNLNFNTDINARLLKPQQVCNMLQVSNYLLRKLVKQGKVRSYNFGRTRRFALVDVINFLDNSKNVVISGDYIQFNGRNSQSYH
ncbi:MAG: helix-turn-helix domain-containing protein [Candidatus Anammoxibacter sp.]